MRGRKIVIRNDFGLEVNAGFNGGGRGAREVMGSNRDERAHEKVRPAIQRQGDLSERQLCDGGRVSVGKKQDSKAMRTERRSVSAACLSAQS